MGLHHYLQKLCDDMDSLQPRSVEVAKSSSSAASALARFGNIKLLAGFATLLTMAVLTLVQLPNLQENFINGQFDQDLAAAQQLKDRKLEFAALDVQHNSYTEDSMDVEGEDDEDHIVHMQNQGAIISDAQADIAADADAQADAQADARADSQADAQVDALLPEGAEGAAHFCAQLKKSSLPLGLTALWQHEVEHIKCSLLHSPAEKSVKGAARDTVLEKLRFMAQKATELLPPTRLRRSLRPQSVSPYHHREQIREILNILWERRHNDTAPPLNILVFGGSPTAGSNCQRKGWAQKKGYCDWPSHFQHFANAYLGFDAIRVFNFAMSATTSEIGTMMIKFGQVISPLMPNGPDIIINAYGINDFHRANEGSPSDRIFQTLFVDFITSIGDRLRDCKGTKPLVIYFDDVIAFCPKNKKTYSHETTELFNSEVERLTKWHQVMTVSYSDVVRDLIHTGREEGKILVDWKGDCVHHPWIGHVSIVLAFAFNSMNTLLDFCQDHSYDENLQRRQSPAPPQSNEAQQQQQQQGEVLDFMFRPLIDSPGPLDSVPAAWKKKTRNCNATEQPSCPFAWVALRQEGEMGSLHNLEEIVQSMDGWENVRKYPAYNYGLFGNLNGIILLNVTVPEKIDTIMIIYMKSYSEKWFNSTVESKVFLRDTSSTPIAEKELSGFHEKKTSEYYTAYLNVDIPENQKQESVLLQLTMTGGTTFRIMGLAFCNSIMEA